MPEFHVQKALEEISDNLYRAGQSFLSSVEMRRADAAEGDVADEEEEAEYYLESAYILTLTLLDRIGLTKIHAEVEGLRQKAESSKSGWITGRMGREEVYLVWSAELHPYVNALKAIYTEPTDSVVPRDLIQILRYTLYAITDKYCFEKPPANEADVHRRIEAVLKCVFPDLLHKPQLNKPIKNFEPDTGLPSTRTLVEYKFITNIMDAKRVADEVLADTRGYTSPDWSKFIYVIYETKRIKSEADWEGLLRASGVPHNANIIVLSGEDVPAPAKATGNASKSRKDNTKGRNK